MAEDSKHKMPSWTISVSKEDAVWVDQNPGNLSTIDVLVVLWARMDICVCI